MGKSMKKSKIAGNLAAVITEAPPPPSSPQQSDPSAYLQLRSRCLLRRVPPAAANSRLRESSPKTPSSRFCVQEENADVGAEDSFGENFFEVEDRDRSTRESTPCSLIRDSSAIDTPGSTTRQRRHHIVHPHIQRNIPTAYEMEEFFACAEKQQQTKFMDKYNFDVVYEVPLPGRYEWVPVLH
ncbi:cyclin-dependent kinase inhibitor 4-like isoform X2 [Lotus japonicus]|uniref:cyclin-dependent kinase inhibitor 4-like isoform X2 n=1 Tax=Lotus japonicus TaxID=34305 RepID=UPI00258FB0F4|nr:cyclin-dependent kinase inhibitor 4-like isoform X2 [Lotus japonicus]